MSKTCSTCGFEIRTDTANGDVNVFRLCRCDEMRAQRQIARTYGTPHNTPSEFPTFTVIVPTVYMGPIEPQTFEWSASLDATSWGEPETNARDEPSIIRAMAEPITFTARLGMR